MLDIYEQAPSVLVNRIPPIALRRMQDILPLTENMSVVNVLKDNERNGAPISLDGRRARTYKRSSFSHGICLMSPFHRRYWESNGSLVSMEIWENSSTKLFPSSDKGSRDICRRNTMVFRSTERRCLGSRRVVVCGVWKQHGRWIVIE